MADSKDGESFLRKVVRFVANPATDWSDINSRQEDSRDLDLERSELKAMVERKRRNDFVRKREFDMLRRLRREGLSPEQLAALGGSSRIDDSEVRLADAGARQDVRVKAKIDEIEQQMVGEGIRPSSTKRSPGFYNAPTQPVGLHISEPDEGGSDHPADSEQLPALPPLPQFDIPPAAAPAPAVMGGGVAPLRSGEASRSSQFPPSELPGPSRLPNASAAPGVAPATSASASPAPRPHQAGPDSGLAVEVSEVVHDPELDEAVIAFANADFAHCEESLTTLVKAGGPRYHHPETWLVLFDLYRATGQQVKFEGLAIEYANLFGASSPQWYSLPKRVAEAAAAEERPKAARPRTGDVGWVSAEVLDLEAVARLRSATLQLPLPWVLDWSSLQSVDAEAASQLTELFKQWAKQRVEMRWQSGEQLLSALQEAAPTGVRDADPVFWMCRLEALRLANRPDQFDEAAIDYCVTYEVSPPSWERTECIVRLAGGGHTTGTPALSMVSEVSTGFMESSLMDDPQGGGQQVATVDLSGQLIGDIGATLTRLDGKLAQAPLVNVSCARLIRVDFIAAGDLLNWVLSKRSQDRSVTFVEAHRLVALFFGAMGINEHARVQVLRD